MKARRIAPFLAACILLSLGAARAQPSKAALADYDAYVAAAEQRLAREHASAATFLATNPQADARLRRGEIILDDLTPSPTLPGALLHHWRATDFAPGAHAADLDRLLRNVSAYPTVFAPQILTASAMSVAPDHFQATMRVRQHHVLTVVMDTAYDVSFARLDPAHGSSISRSTRMLEVDSPGTAAEHALSAAEEHGFLWRQTTFWSWVETPAGLYLQIESISLSRSIPTGLGWAVRPFVASVPRESLEFTLHATINALRR